MKKICTKCKENKPLEEYYKDKNKEDGRYSACKKCHNALQKIYYTEHKQKILRDHKKYNAQHKQQISTQREKYYINHKQEIEKYRKKYSKTVKGKLTNAKGQAKYRKSDKGKLTRARANANYYKTEKGRLNQTRSRHIRRSREANTQTDLRFQEKNIILFLQNYKCIYPNCIDYFDEVKPTLDHIKPVSKGGDLIKDNVQ